MLPQPLMTAPDALPAALPRPPTLPIGSTEEHQLHLPTNAAGAAKTRRKRVTKPNQLVTFLPSHVPVLPMPSLPASLSQPPPSAPEVPASMMSYRRKRLQKEREGHVQRQRYNRKSGTTCKQCNKERLPENHRQYFGNWWCQEKAEQTHEDWMEKLREKGVGKRRKTDASDS